MKLALKIILGIVLAIVVLKIFFFLLGVFTLLAWALMGIAIIAAIVYFCVPGFFDAPPEKEPVLPIKIYDAINGKTTLFADKPSIKQMANPDAALGEAGTIELDNDIIIKVVEDDGSEVVKIKLQSGDKKGKVGWVERSAVQGYKRDTAS